VVRPRDHWERDAFKAGAWTSIPPGVLLGGIVVGAIGGAATFLGIGRFGRWIAGNLLRMTTTRWTAGRSGRTLRWLKG
jgi:hypothetical protein